MTTQRLGEMLVEAGLVTDGQIADATARHANLRLGSALIRDGVVSADAINRTLAQQHGLTAVRLSDLEHPDPAARALIPDALARRLHAVALAIQGSGSLKILLVAMRDPGDLGAVDELTFATGLRIDARVAPEVCLADALEQAGVIAPGAQPAARTATGPIPLARGNVRTPSAGIAASVRFAPPPPTQPAAGDADGAGGLELDIDPSMLAKRGRSPTTPPSSHAAAPASPGSASPPGSPAATPLPPLQIDAAPDPHQSGAVTGVLGSMLKLAIPIGLIVLAVVSYKRCMVSTTKSVGTHWDSTELALSIDFPDSGWRVAPGMGKTVTKARAEYFYRGNAPEFPVVGMIVLRGDAADVTGGAEALLAEVVSDVVSAGCKSSYARDGAIMCSGLGTVGLFGKAMQNAEVEVHGWALGSELILVAMIKPDHTLSETEMILKSIVEYAP